MMQLFFFEDPQHTNFHPLTLTRPVDDLRTGILTIAQKWRYALKTSLINRVLRPELKGVFESGRAESGQSCIWINSRYLPSKSLVAEISSLSEGQCLKHKETIIAARVDDKRSAQWHDEGSPDFNTLFVLETNDFPSVTHLWDLFLLNGEQITNDIKLLQLEASENAQISDHAVLENRDKIYIQDGATVEAGCVLNAEDGPIFIGEGATVMAGSFVRGPVAICEGVTIKMGAKIYGKTTIGPVCKVGGEVSNTIFHSYSNKAHGGYIGNSVVGQWCNLGAGTTVSNLKTNYSNIRVADWETKEEKDTGLQFFGIIFGDHSKTAINSVINSGTLCGVSCNLLSRDFPPKLIHSFSWVGSNVIQPYKLDKALETMEIMMGRRNISITESYRIMMRHIFKDSRQPSD